MTHRERKLAIERLDRDIAEIQADDLRPETIDPVLRRLAKLLNVPDDEERDIWWRFYASLVAQRYPLTKKVIDAWDDEQAYIEAIDELAEEAQRAVRRLRALRAWKTRRARAQPVPDLIGEYRRKRRARAAAR